MGIKFYDSNGKYWGEYDETRSLFIPSEEVLADRKTENSSEKPNNSTISKMEQVEDEPTGYNLSPFEDEPQTERPCDNCQEWDCYGCDYKQTERKDK